MARKPRWLLLVALVSALGAPACGPRVVRGQGETGPGDAACRGDPRCAAACAARDRTNPDRDAEYQERCTAERIRVGLNPRSSD